LVQADLATSWKADLGDGSPASLLDLGTMNASLAKCPHLSWEVIAHHVQLRPGALGWVHREFGWGQTEDQPSATRVHMIEAEHVGQEGAIGVSVAAEDDEVSTEDHWARLPAPVGNVQQLQPLAARNTSSAA
jgi:hypothetical protein